MGPENDARLQITRQEAKPEAVKSPQWGLNSSTEYLLLQLPVIRYAVVSIVSIVMTKNALGLTEVSESQHGSFS